MSDDSGVGSLLCSLCAVAVGGYIALVGYNEAWYAWQYDVSSSSVHVQPKPKDCDFIQAPLGAKSCSYKPIVSVWNAEGVLIDGLIKPKFGTDSKTGKPIVSYDDGKNWQWYEGAAIPNPKAASVNVAWSRVAD